MTSIKPFFILYLLISSFALSICEEGIKKEKGAGDYINDIFNKIPTDLLGSLKYITQISASVSIAWNAEKIIGSIEQLLVTVGSGVKYTYSSLYTLIETAYGVKVAGALAIGNYVIILAGASYLIYKIVNKDKYVKVGDIEYSSKEHDKNSDQK